MFQTTNQMMMIIEPLTMDHEDDDVHDDGDDGMEKQRLFMEVMITLIISKHGE